MTSGTCTKETYCKPSLAIITRCRQQPDHQFNQSRLRISFPTKTQPPTVERAITLTNPISLQKHNLLHISGRAQNNIDVRSRTPFSYKNKSTRHTCDTEKSWIMGSLLVTSKQTRFSWKCAPKILEQRKRVIWGTSNVKGNNNNCSM